MKTLFYDLRFWALLWFLSIALLTCGTLASAQKTKKWQVRQAQERYRRDTIDIHYRGTLYTDSALTALRNKATLDSLDWRVLEAKRNH